ncbi:prohibitin family protein [Chitinibacter bivalviorum]|uniref:Prohibitin family protein n=1 Tax=Chitinibacter bivalviorum TaxID=2739434 RepID=A0A7H9BFZ5_9NEIS|nr:SPFH domain-containing protein [Chitinibacter bivalviorum]QLG87166.1 prohibitin family protein [Chitinibacter bivalviorum]
MQIISNIRVLGMLAVAAVIGFILHLFVASVSANHVGVEFNRIDGKVEPIPLSSGWHFIGIGTSVVEFPTFTQTYTWTQSKTEGSPADESMNFQVASGVVINADISISYSIDSSKAPVLYQKYKRGYEEITSQIIRNAIRNALNNYGTAYDAEGLLAGGKIRLAEQVRAKINHEMNQYGIVVEQFGFVNELRLPANIQGAINAKIQATQEALQSEALLRKNQADAANAVAVAKGKADAKIAEAQGDARALEVVGEAIKKYGAEAAQVKNQTLWIEKWNGQLPTTSLGTNTTAMIGVK